MKIQGKNYRTIWLTDGERSVSIIDQRYLPHQFAIEELHTVEDMEVAIRDMHLRGAPLIGVAAAYGMYLAMLEAADKSNIQEHLITCAERLKATRPTAVNLQWAVDKQLEAISKGASVQEKIQIAKDTAAAIADDDVDSCRKIGMTGAELIEDISKQKNGERVNILTHCNAGWLACVDYGSATASIYEAAARGIDLHVWVDETRPRNQGAGLTAWELLNQGIPHTVITDNTGGHLMQHGMVDVVITGADRVTRSGDAANKIGTYLKALAANDNDIPFYVAFPSSTFDWSLRDGITEINIEERSGDEVRYVHGWNGNEITKVLITPADSPVVNYGFDVTPARLITGLITEQGMCRANERDILKLYPGKFTPDADEEGIKFRCELIELPPFEPERVADLNACREKIYEEGLVGVTPDGIGYGNISQRVWEHQFIISGTATGKLKKLGPEHYTLVAAYDIDENSVVARGPIKPSSESLTHAMIYECAADVNAVIHVHDAELWQKLLNTRPSTAEDVPYGSPEMAREIQRLFSEQDADKFQIFAMAGHENGVIAFGNNLEEAWQAIVLERDFVPDRS